MHNPKSTLLDTRIISIFLMALSSIWLLRDSVYPHVCGGTQTGCGRECQFDGLSPRVRGNRHDHIGDCQRERSIPACAGGTAGALVLSLAEEGLSPRVRGNRLRCRANSGAHRSIPACAGEPGGDCVGY